MTAVIQQAPAVQTATAAIEAVGVNKSFGSLHVARNIDFRLEVGARHALIGPNGAGKTTFINLLTGVLQPTSGQVLVAGADVSALPPEARVRRGVARTFQINSLFRSLTVLENVAMAVAEREKVTRRLFRPFGRFTAVLDEAMAVLEQLRLSDIAAEPISALAYGRQRLVEIAIALALKPRVLLLDEPAAGIPSAEHHILLDVIDRLPPEIAVLIIEHDMDLVFRIANRITVLVSGAILTTGTPADIAADERVREVYLGSKRVHAHG